MWRLIPPASTKISTTTTTTSLAQDLSIQQKQIMEEKEDIVSSPTRVPTHYLVNPRYNRLGEKITPCHQQVRCDSLQQAKQRNFSNNASNSPRFRLNKHFPLSLGKSMQRRPLLPKEGGLIQVDIYGHPPIPTSSTHSYGNLLFLAIFRFLNFRGHF
jgi:hypothetical protein